MKKQIAIIALLFISLSAAAQTNKDTTKPAAPPVTAITITIPIQAIQVWYDVIDKSEASHTTVEALKKILQEEYQEQIVSKTQKK